MRCRAPLHQTASLPEGTRTCVSGCILGTRNWESWALPPKPTSAEPDASLLVRCNTPLLARKPGWTKLTYGPDLEDHTALKYGEDSERERRAGQGPKQAFPKILSWWHLSPNYMVIWERNFSFKPDQICLTPWSCPKSLPLEELPLPNSYSF